MYVLSLIYKNKHLPWEKICSLKTQIIFSQMRFPGHYFIAIPMFQQAHRDPSDNSSNKKGKRRGKYVNVIVMKGKRICEPR